MSTKHENGRLQAQETLPLTHWHLHTDDTLLTLAVANDRPAIYELRSLARGWNWAARHTEIPLIETVSIGGVRHDLRWAYQDACVDNSAGTKVALRFTCNNPSLELTSTWWARPGAGPVEHRMTVCNRSGGALTLQQKDLVVADCSFTADASAELWRFNKLGYIPGGQGPDANKQEPALLRDAMRENTSVETKTKNESGWVKDAWLPYHVLDVGQEHGLYIGYVSSFGKFTVSTGSDPLDIRYRAVLWDLGCFTVEDRQALPLPGLFFGTYVGDVDDGCNRMKQWFWNHKLPQSIRDNADEPLIEYCVPADEAGLKQAFEKHAYAIWGGELAKIDIEWTVPSREPGGWNNQMHNCYDWTPDPNKWPNGMTGGEIAHQHRQKLALYFFDTYKSCDPGTPEGRKLMEGALRTRYDDWHYDYYRSDFFPEGRYNYRKHLGYMELLDNLISERPGFRYEHCSGGGGLKDFDTLQRVSVMTTEDSAGCLHYRKSAWSNSYAINPVQLKCDVLMSCGQTGHAADELNDNIMEPYVDTPEYFRYCLRSGFMGAIMVTGFTTQAMIDAYRAHWPLYKREMRPILRGADVYHILPYPDGVNWDGIQYYNRGIQRGAVLLFKPSASVADERTIRFRGLERDQTYWLDFQDRKNQCTTLPGAQLMDEGLTVRGMTGDYASEIIWINMPGGPGCQLTERQRRV